ncbi:unnamed protein product [Cladocopium goreaui]|uniref:Uncharacterized protein n=1 Tax=Cladocopium goreaui TaxID=2562237 RepID=A0A9P1G3U2_9DINO|nr:unnamed protein product [Cladocopium goreaui]
MLVFEKMTGRTLTKFIPSENPEEDVRLQILLDIAKVAGRLLRQQTPTDHCPEQTFFCSPTRSKLEEKHHFSGAYATAPPQTICLSRPVLVVRISKSRHVSSQFLQNEIRLNSSKQETTSIPVIEKVWSA